jgi:hypothetical protein
MHDESDHELDDRDILRSLRGLGELQPDAADTREVVRSAQRAVGRRTRIARWVVGVSAAAAGVALVVGLAMLSVSGGTARAAEALADAARSSKGYKGWVHATMGEGRPQWGVTHFNNDSGMWATEVHDGDRVEIQMYDRAARTETKYFSSDGVIRIGTMHESFAERWKAMIQDSPLTLAENMPSVPASKVKQSEDGGLMRYDIELPPEPASRPAKGSAGEKPTSMTMWVDPKTKLIQRSKSTEDGQEITCKYAYGPPAIRDVYDLGVPRDAQVVDARPPADVDALFKRLERRYDEAFGDYVAVVTQYQVEFDGRKPAGNEDDGAAVELSARQGRACLAMRYLLRDPGASNSTGSHTVPRPAGWPKPELKPLLDALKAGIPTNSIVSDGKAAWSGLGVQPEQYRIIDVTSSMGQQTLARGLSFFSLPAKIWPTRANLGLFGPDAKAQLLTDPAKPGLIGLRTDRVYFGAGMKPMRSMATFWFDPSRDDMPVESVSVTYKGTTDVEDTRFEHRFTGYEKTSKGRWYPSEWVITTKMAEPNRHAYTEKVHARVWSDEKLPDEWFRRPKGEMIEVK